MNTPLRIEPGTLVDGRYRLIEPPGYHYFTEAWRAGFPESDGSPSIAVELASCAGGRRKYLEPPYRQQVETTEGVDHPGLAVPLAAGFDEGLDCAYLVSPWVDGTDLAHLLVGNASALTRSMAWAITMGLGDAVATLHEHGVLHGDLVPERIRIVAPRHPCLIGFDSAQRMGNADHPPKVARLTVSQAYAAPEVFDAPVPEPSQDVFSFALIVYQMFAGHHPFGGRASPRARDRGLVPEPLSDLSTRQNDALCRALTFDAQARTSSMRAFLRDFVSLRGQGLARLARVKD